MFECEIDSCFIFKKIFEVLGGMTNEINWSLTSTGIRFHSLTQANVVLVDVVIKPTAFKKFQIDRPFVIGTPISSLLTILKGYSSEQLTFKTKHDHDRLEIKFRELWSSESENDEKTDCATSSHEKERKFPKYKNGTDYELKLMNIDAVALEIPADKYTSVVTFSSSHFQRICRDHIVIGPDVNVIIDPEKITFITNGDFGSVEKQFFGKRKDQNSEKQQSKECNSTKQAKRHKSNDDIIIETNEEKISIKLSLTYLLKVSKCDGIAATMTMQTNLKGFVKFEYVTEDENVRMTFYVAPKLDEMETESEENLE